jgi:serine/threonine-protein kinase
VPKTVGPYHIERLLGRGGFSDTFLARRGGTGPEVALKVPHIHRVDDAEFRARFYQEAQLGARLIHPNLVRILDPGLETGRPYLAMEYLPGQGLDERLHQEGALPLGDCLAIALGVAAAMAHAHAHGVVHRDLKPGNIMLTAQGPKVMDLGIARIMDAATVTSTYAFLGTPLYAAPEAQFKTHVGPAADRYSLGVILFHMLAGAPPFQGETPFEILNRHRSDLPPDLLQLRSDLPPLLGRLVARLLDKEPDQRPDDSEILRVLTEVAASLSAPPDAAPRH